MIIVLNGPIGIGKSTLAEALVEEVEGAVMLNGDQLIAVNPPQANELDHLHATIELLVGHHRNYGYRHFVIDHIWTSRAELDDLEVRLRRFSDQIRCFRLILDPGENLRRIEQRARARAIDEESFEHRTFERESAALSAVAEGVLGEPFDMSAPPTELVTSMRGILGL